MRIFKFAEIHSTQMLLELLLASSWMLRSSAAGLASRSPSALVIPASEYLYLDLETSELLSGHIC